MGITTGYLNFLDSIVEDVFPHSKNLKMLELGNQKFEDGTVGKTFFKNRGYFHISIDLNGEDESLIKDLSKENDFLEFHNTFDIITNFGTTEHVEPFESQYTAFKIIHDCLAIGGVAIHLNPDVDARDERNLWNKHCQYYYSSELYDQIVKFSDSRLLRNEEINGLRAACYMKLGDRFIEKDLFLNNVSIRDGKLGGVERSVWI